MSIVPLDASTSAFMEQGPAEFAQGIGVFAGKDTETGSVGCAIKETPTFSEEFCAILRRYSAEVGEGDSTEILAQLKEISFHTVQTTLSQSEFGEGSLGRKLLAALLAEVKQIESVEKEIGTACGFESPPSPEDLSFYQRKEEILVFLSHKLKPNLFSSLFILLRPEFQREPFTMEILQRLVLDLPVIDRQFCLERDAVCKELNLPALSQDSFRSLCEEVQDTVQFLGGRIDQLPSEVIETISSKPELSSNTVMKALKAEKQALDERRKEIRNFCSAFYAMIQHLHLPNAPIPFDVDGPFFLSHLKEMFENHLWGHITQINPKDFLGVLFSPDIQDNPFVEVLKRRFVQTESFRAIVREMRQELETLLPGPFAKVEDEWERDLMEISSIPQACCVFTQDLLERVDRGEIKEEHFARLASEAPHNFLGEYLLRYLKNRTALLIEDLQSRPYSQYVKCGALKVGGFLSTPLEQRLDQQRLVSLMNAHIVQFRELVELGSRGGGYIEKEHLPEGTSVGVRADIHSDLPSLFETLKLWRGEGKMDDHYTSLNNTHFYFLGDYTDRGVNDPQVLKVLFSLKKNDPEHIHLLRGNHESKAMHLLYAMDKSFIEKYGDLLERCYASFPLAVCISGPSFQKGDHVEDQFVHLSHGLFSLPASLTQFLQSGLKRVSLADVHHSLGGDEQPGRSPKQQAADARIHVLIRDLLKYTSLDTAYQKSADQIMWTDMQSERRNATDISPRQTGGDTILALASGDIHAHSRKNSTTRVKIKFYLRGHGHQLREGVVPRKKGGQKVIATTLPVGCIGGLYAELFHEMGQGMMLTVHSKVEAWEKQLVEQTVDPDSGEIQYTLHQEKKGMYESFESPSAPTPTEPTVAKEA